MLLGPEFSWVVKGWTRQTIPMARLAEYIRELSKLLGQETKIHLMSLEDSSLALVSKTEQPIDGGKIDARVSAVRRGEGAIDATRAYANLNEMLANDNGSARLYRGTAVVINFPGKVPAEPALIEVQDYGSVTGYLYMLYQQKDAYLARLRIDSDTTLRCFCTEDVLPQLKETLFDTVRVSGSGRWGRTISGIWQPVNLTIEEVQKINRAPFREAIDSLRRIDIQWPDDPLGYLLELNEEDSVVQ
jgi:hypothetical protein